MKINMKCIVRPPPVGGDFGCFVSADGATTLNGMPVELGKPYQVGKTYSVSVTLAPTPGLK